MIRVLTRKAAAVVTMFAMAVVPAVTVTVFSTTAAYAAKGGNGNGNGNGNGRANSNRDNANNARSNRNNRSSSNGNGRASRSGNDGSNNGHGAISRELGGLNAADANPTALANAAPNSTSGKLYSYQQASLSAAQAQARVAETGNLYQAIRNMSEAQFYDLNPTLDYTNTLASVGADYQAALTAQEGANVTTQQALASLTGGRALSNAALNELHQMLGL